MIEFRILGPVELWISGKRVDLGPARQQGILAALLVEPERPISIQTLVDRVWGTEPPKEVRNLVYTYITRLRRIMRRASQEFSVSISVRKEAAGYVLGISPDQVDLSKFRSLLADSRSASAGDPRRRHALSQALRLWRGQALDGLNSEWAAQLRDSLQQLKFEALAEWADAEMYANCAGTAIDPLRQALLEDPLAEQLHERLVRALHLNGRNNEALRQFERARTIIADELGTDPSRGLQELHQQLLHNDVPDGTGRTSVPVAVAPGIPPQWLPAGAVPAQPAGPGAEADLRAMDLDGFGGRPGEADLCRMLTSRACLVIDLVEGRGELTDAAWEQLEPLLPKVDGSGRPWCDHRQVVTSVLWLLWAGAPWRDLPDRCEPWQSICKRWEADGTWARLLEHVQVRDDTAGRVEWTISMDSPPTRPHQHVVRAREKGPRTGMNWKIRAARRRARPPAAPEAD